MRWRIHRRIPLVAVAIVACVALAVHLLLHVPLWLALAFPFLGMLINGLVATIADNRRGAPEDSSSEEP